MEHVVEKAQNFARFIGTLRHKSSNAMMLHFIATAVENFDINLLVGFIDSNFGHKSENDIYQYLMEQLALSDLNVQEEEKLRTYIRLFQNIQVQLTNNAQPLM